MVRFQIYLVIGILLTATCYANDVSFEVTVDKDKVSLSDSVELNLSFHGTQEVPTPLIMDIRVEGPR